MFLSTRRAGKDLDNCEYGEPSKWSRWFFGLFTVQANVIADAPMCLQTDSARKHAVGECRPHIEGTRKRRLYDTFCQTQKQKTNSRWMHGCSEQMVVWTCWCESKDKECAKNAMQCMPVIRFACKRPALVQARVASAFASENRSHSICSRTFTGRNRNHSISKSLKRITCLIARVYNFLEIQHCKIRNMFLFSLKLIIVFIKIITNTCDLFDCRHSFFEKNWNFGATYPT